MTKSIPPLKLTLEPILFSVFFILLCTATSFSQDFEIHESQDLYISANILSVATNINSNQMSISYNGISSPHRFFIQSNRDSYARDTQNLAGSDFEKQDAAGDDLFNFGGKLKQMTRYFLRYFNVDDGLNDAADSKFLLKSKVDTDKMNPNDFEFDLSVNVGYDSDTILKMSAIKFKSYWKYTYVNAVYHYEKSEFEVGLSNAILNGYLLDGMRLELQANPVAGSGALLLTMSI